VELLGVKEGCGTGECGTGGGGAGGCVAPGGVQHPLHKICHFVLNFEFTVP
jgi:hypothetical protein